MLGLHNCLLVCFNQLWYQVGWVGGVSSGVEGCMLHVDTYAHSKSGIAYQELAIRVRWYYPMGNPASSRGCHQTAPMNQK
jgi:hypothetical protein